MVQITDMLELIYQIHLLAIFYLIFSIVSVCVIHFSCLHCTYFVVVFVVLRLSLHVQHVLHMPV